MRDFQGKYVNSSLGALWSLLNPLSQILVYTLVFSQVMQARLPGMESSLGYSIYLCAGMLPWLFFHELVTRNLNVFLEQGNLLKKMRFPRSSLPLYVLVSAAINFFILFLFFLLFLIIVGHWPGGLILLAMVPLLLLQASFAVGLGLLLGTMHVFFRDVGHTFTIVLQFWFWLTPIVYPSNVLPAHLAWLLELNPLTAVMQSYQRMFLLHAFPDWFSLLPFGILALTLLVLAYFVFVALGGEMVDEL